MTSVWPWLEPSKNLVPTIKPIQVVWNKKAKYNFIRYFIDYRCLLNHLKIYEFIIMAAIFLKTIIFSCLRCYKNKSKHIYELIEQTTIAICLLNLKKQFEWNPSNRFCVIPGTSSKNVTLGIRHSKIWNKKKRFLSSSLLFSDTKSINFSFLKFPSRRGFSTHIYTEIRQ